MQPEQICELILSNLMRSKHLAGEFIPYFHEDKYRPYVKLGYWVWRTRTHFKIQMYVKPNSWAVGISKYGKERASFQWDELTQSFKEVKIPQNFGRGTLFLLGISTTKTFFQRFKQRVRILYKIFLTLR